MANWLKEFLIDVLVPRLADQDWLMYKDRYLLKIRDETLFGLGFRSSDRVPGHFSLHVFISPLYMPDPLCRAIAAPIDRWLHTRWTDRLFGVAASWWDLNTAESTESAAQRLTQTLNSQITPYLAILRDGQTLMHYGKRHPFDPLLGWIQGARNGREEEAFAYIAAWSGDSRKARSFLKSALANRRADENRLHVLSSHSSDQPSTEGHDGRILIGQHLQRTFALLNQPHELRSFLQGTADSSRTALNLSSAQPVLQVIARRRQRQLKAMQTP